MRQTDGNPDTGHEVTGHRTPDTGIAVAKKAVPFAAVPSSSKTACGVSEENGVGTKTRCGCEPFRATNPQDPTRRGDPDPDANS